MNSTIALIDPRQDQTQTNRSNLIAAFRRVVAKAGRRQATDLHVRRLLNYVCAKDVDGQGAQRSLKQIANRLVLSESTCRRVIRRAVKQFGLLIVIPQRHVPGGQTVNRYSINWNQVRWILDTTAPTSSATPTACPDKTRAHSHLPLCAISKICPSGSPLATLPPVTADHAVSVRGSFTDFRRYPRPFSQRFGQPLRQSESAPPLRQGGRNPLAFRPPTSSNPSKIPSYSTLPKRRFLAIMKVPPPKSHVFPSSFAIPQCVLP